MCLHWRLFGSSGHKAYADDLVVRRFTHCAREYNHHVKTIARRSCMAQMRAHTGRLTSGTYADANAAPVRPSHKVEPVHSRYTASINHYVLKSVEEYQAKVARGQGGKAPDSPDKRAKFTPEFWAAHDRNDVEDFAIARFIPALELEMARLLPSPDPVADDSRGAWHRRAWHRLGPLFRTALRSAPTRRGA